jgi:precorrin-2 dehydrogenase/sirohydrochlorin ferrochelatase
VPGYYPIFLDLRNRLAVVVGGGRVASRKAAGLMAAGARVRVIAPRLSARLKAHETERRPYRPGDLKGAVLAFAATGDRTVNRAVAMEARRRRIPVNVADSLEECTFLVPARVTRGDWQIAISSGGRNPKLTKQMRRWLQAALRRVKL